MKAFRHIRPVLDRSVANTMACSIVTSRLDYCNSLLYGTSVANITKLQRVQNTLARIAPGAKRKDHITPVLHDLHWLPVKKRIEYKVALITHKVLHHRQPQYLAQLVDVYQPPRQLRSSSQHLVRRSTVCRTKLGERCFLSAAAITWNRIHEQLRAIPEEKQFKAKLKTFLFSSFMGEGWMCMSV